MNEINREISPALVNQMLIFMRSVNLLEHASQQNIADLYSRFKIIADMHQIDISEVGNGDTKRLMAETALSILEQGRVIEKKETGMYAIKNDTVYNDIVYTAKIRKQQAESMRTIMKLQSKIPYHKLAKGLGLGRQIADIMRDTAEFFRGEDGAKLAQAFIDRNKLNGKTGGQFLDDASDLAGKCYQKANDLTKLEHAFAVGQMVRTEDEDELEKRIFKDEEPLYNPQNEEFKRDLGISRSLLTEQTIQMLNGVLDVDKLIRAGEGEITKEMISPQTRYELSKTKNIWMISAVKFGKSIMGNFTLEAKKTAVKWYDKLLNHTKQDPEPYHDPVRIAMKALILGDHVLNQLYKQSRGSYSLDDFTMTELDKQMKDMRSGTRRSVDEQASEIVGSFATQNLFRCGISRNIPGWFRALRVDPEVERKVYVYLIAGMNPGIGGITWDKKLAADNLEETEKKYETISEKDPVKAEQKLQKIRAAFVSLHEKNECKVNNMRKKANYPPLDHRTYFNPMSGNAALQKSYEYEVKGVDDFMSKDFSAEYAFEKKHLDAIVVARNDTITLLGNGEEEAVSALVGDSGYAVRMQVNEQSTLHHVDEAKDVTLDSMRHAWTSLTQKELLSQCEKGRAVELYKTSKLLLDFQYLAEWKGEDVCFYDPDGKHSFLLKADEEKVGDLPASIVNHCNQVKVDMKQSAILGSGLCEVIKTLNRDIASADEDVFRGSIRTPYTDTLDIIRNVNNRLSNMMPMDVLNPESREMVRKRVQQDLGRIDLGILMRQRKEYLTTVRSFEKLRKEDPLLAWCKTTNFPCERDGDMIRVDVKGHIVKVTQDGDSIGRNKEIKSELNVLYNAVDNSEPDREKQMNLDELLVKCRKEVDAENKTVERQPKRHKNRSR